MQYDAKNLQSLEKSIIDIREKMDGQNLFRINIDNLVQAIQELPKEDREHIEKFWGLTGGTNHSTKKFVKWNDKAYLNMCENVEKSISKLFEIDRVFMYEENLKEMIAFLAKKIDKGDTQISDLDAIKYIMAFSGILDKGPQMSFEKDALTFDQSYKDDFTFDEYTVIRDIYQELQNVPDNFIDLKVLVGWIEWLDFNDSNTIKKTFGIELPNLDYLREAEKLLQQLPLFKGKQIFPTNNQMNEVERMRKLSVIRAFKERIFSYGAWETTSTLIFEHSINLEEFFETVRLIKKDRAKIEEFKTGEMQVRTSTGIRNLDIFTIGGLEFTDPDEIRFLYTVGNCIQ